jgi:hypothetical protein
MEELIQWQSRVNLDLNSLEKNLKDWSNGKTREKLFSHRILQATSALNPVLENSLQHVSQLKLDISHFLEDSKGTLGGEARINLSALMEWMQKSFFTQLKGLLEVCPIGTMQTACVSSVLLEVRPETPPTGTMDGNGNITNSFRSRGKVGCSVKDGAEDWGRCNAFGEYAKKDLVDLLASFEHTLDQDVVDPRRWTRDDAASSYASDSGLAQPKCSSYVSDSLRVMQKGVDSEQPELYGPCRVAASVATDAQHAERDIAPRSPKAELRPQGKDKEDPES